jgi:3-phenylpropionate/trans-cinnamate dioxygenase ferredoxin subunit
MANFIAVMNIEELPPGKGTTVTVEGKDVAVFNVDGHAYAMDDSCAHAGASLGWGRLEGTFVTCRAHGLKFDVTTGKVVGNPAVCVATYEAKIEAGKILVSL